MTDKEKISKIKKLFVRFHERISVLRKKQMELFRRVLKLKEEKEFDEVRKKINEIK
ncbi:MAG: hypothetical protein KAI67_05805 [Candidatus Pacebacteria bacterium]|nr:hypothetical protein [Candidatus Paceibacterota bacterium]